MAVSTKNTFGSGTLGILGIRGYFREGSVLVTGISASATSITLEDATFVENGQSLRLGSGSNGETVTVTGAPVGNTVSISATTNAHSAGILVRDLNWIDLGILKDWSPDEDIEEFEFEGARSGLVQVFDKLTIRAELNYTFRSTNVTDNDVQDLHAGAVGATDVAANGYVVEVSFNTTRGELLFVRENAQASKDSKLIYHPRATIKRDGESGTPGEEEASLDFTATVLADENFTIPDTIDAGSPAADYGFVWTVPTANLDARETTASA